MKTLTYISLAVLALILAFVIAYYLGVFEGVKVPVTPFNREEEPYTPTYEIMDGKG